MAFRRVPMAQGKEQTVAPEGEYRVVVAKVEDKPTKRGDPMDVLTLRIVGEDGAYSPFRHYVTYPKEGDEPDRVAMKVREVRRLCHLFGVPYTEEGFDPEDLAGAETTARLTVDTYERDDGTTTENNKLVLPRVADDE